MGRLNTRQTKYIYKVSSVDNIYANLNSYLGMRFYDSGFTTNQNIKIYYNEANTLAIWGYLADPYWRITTIANVGDQYAPRYQNVSAGINGNPIGTYQDFFNYFDSLDVSTLVISAPSISIKKQNLGGGKISLYKAPS